MAFIPARGGSKGLPRKNILDLCGMPLLAYTIRAAKAAGCFERVIVSTEDEEIKEVALRWGADVPFLRPERLSQDTSQIKESILYTLDMLRKEGFDPNICVELYPTSPFRTPSFLRELVAKLRTGHSNVITAAIRPVKENYSIMENGTKRPIRLASPFDVQEALTQLGLFCGYWLKNYEGCRPWGLFIKEIVEPAQLVDVDSLADFNLAEHIVKNGLFDFGI